MCRPRRLRDLKKLARSGAPDMFITLTVNPEVGESPADRARLLVENWRRARRAAIKRFSLKELPFIAIFEKTKRGEPHLHILARSRFIPHEWLSRFMGDAIGAPVVDIRRVKNQKQAVAYVSKYVGKAPHSFEGTKRYWRSQDFAISPGIQEKAARRPGEFFDVVFMDYFTFLELRAMQGQYQGEKNGKAVLYGYGARSRC